MSCDTTLEGEIDDFKMELVNELRIYFGNKVSKALPLVKPESGRLYQKFNLSRPIITIS